MDSAIQAVLNQGGLLGALLVLAILALGYLVKALIRTHAEHSAELMKVATDTSAALTKAADVVDRNTRAVEALRYGKGG